MTDTSAVETDTGAGETETVWVRVVRARRKRCGFGMSIGVGYGLEDMCRFEGFLDQEVAGVELMDTLSNAGSILMLLVSVLMQKKVHLK